MQSQASARSGNLRAAHEDPVSDLRSSRTGTEPSVAAGSAKRLDFLDAVRAVAALLVLLQHSLEGAGLVSIAPGGFGVTVLDFGQAGVMAFFLVSGFIIPVSLERKNSLASFWISRLFRLYPMYILAWVLAAAFIFQLADASYGVNLLAHLAFIQELAVAMPDINTVPGSWTLGMEMAWYIFFSALFLLRCNRSTNAIVLCAAAVAFALLLFSIVTHHSLPFGRVGLFLGFLAGLTLYRNYSGQLVGRNASALVSLVVLISALAAYVRFHVLVGAGREYAFSASAVLASWALGYAVFLLGYLTRHVSTRLDAVLGQIGKVSYSIYLVHILYIKLALYLHIEGWLLPLFVLVASVATSFVTYSLVERPFVKLGHRVGALSERWAGSPSR